MPVVNEIAHRRQKQSAPAVEAAALDDNVWTNLMDDFLVDPEVERTLLRGNAQPKGVAPPRPVELVVVQIVEVINNRVL